MNIIKKLRSWYYELWDYIDESEYVLINKKGKVVAIIDRLNPITYTILSHIFTESHDIYATKGYGELVILDESFAIKVTKVL